jgi:hypothetical protein
MSTIYVVTSGSYSDYHTDALFSTKEKAQAWIDIASYGKGGDYQIEEWPLDEQVGVVWRTLHTATIYLDDGKIEDGHSNEVLAQPEVRTNPASHFPGNQRYREGCRVQSYVSQEHARKLAVEFRQEWLRKQVTPPRPAAP